MILLFTTPWYIATILCISAASGYYASAFAFPPASFTALTINTSKRSSSSILFSTKEFISNNNNSNSNSNSNEGDFSFFDQATIYIRAGSGGQGSSTYKKAKKGSNGIPDGGSGGQGGNVVLKLDPSLNTLAGLSRRALRPNAFGGGGAAASSKRMGHSVSAAIVRDDRSSNDDDDDDDNKGNANFVARERLLSFRAQDGTAGGRMYDNGRVGEDCEVLVPPGTVVKVEVMRVSDEHELEGDENMNDSVHDDDSVNSATDEQSATNAAEEEEEEDNNNYDLVEIGTVSYENPTLIVAKGGRGGEGTAVLKVKKRGATRRGPEGGERHRLRLTLKIVADIALVGVPNAGKVRVACFTCFYVHISVF